MTRTSPRAPASLCCFWPIGIRSPRASPSGLAETGAHCGSADLPPTSWPTRHGRSGGRRGTCPASASCWRPASAGAAPCVAARMSAGPGRPWLRWTRRPALPRNAAGGGRRRGGDGESLARLARAPRRLEAASPRTRDLGPRSNRSRPEFMRRGRAAELQWAQRAVLADYQRIERPMLFRTRRS